MGPEATKHNLATIVRLTRELAAELAAHAKTKATLGSLTGGGAKGVDRALVGLLNDIERAEAELAAERAAKEEAQRKAEHLRDRLCGMAYAWSEQRVALAKTLQLEAPTLISIRDRERLPWEPVGPKQETAP